ncbi:MAG: IS1634 family transposase [Planctomycetes bacterium]|nr:IS1634 family transposase [Planctomycetota bacterium]
MHIVENKSPSKTGKKIYSSTLIRESYREVGKVKKRTIANLSRCTPGEISAIKLALKYKDDLTALGSLKETIELEEGLSVGAVWSVYQVAKGLEIEKALGGGFEGKLALWQVIARVIDQGSRLSAVRLAQTHGACDILGIRRGFDENDLYDNLKWIANKQDTIEERLFSARRGKEIPEIFLYDVTSSYLEGDKNYFGDYGYPRDGKRGKKQIVIGLLCDEGGEPVSTEVFAGNTQDPKTFASQVQKVAERFGCKRVTFVGDRGMIKRTQIEELPEGFHYITAITKPQMHALIKEGVIQLNMFEEQVCEIEEEDIRYILRRNPVRGEEIAENRMSKLETIEGLVRRKNLYLEEHPRAKEVNALKEVQKKIEKLKIHKWLKTKLRGRELRLEIDEAELKERMSLDGCYVIKTDLLKETADKQVIHDRYKDLAEVERAFRTFKTELLEVRPVFVRTEKSTRGHVFVVMLAYMIARKLRQSWAELDLTVEEGLNQLSSLCSTEVKVKGQGSCLKIPRPRENSRKLLKALNIKLPSVLPHKEVPVVTRKKLKEQRKRFES